MGKNYLGVDPGVTGGLALILHTGEVFVYPSPYLGVSSKIIDKPKLRMILENVKQTYPNTEAVLEEVNSVFGASAGANFKFGRNCGLMEGVLLGLGYTIHPVRAKAWQKQVWTSSDRVTKIIKGKEVVDTKGTSRAAAQRIFPNVNLLATSRSKVPHEGIVDALLIAEAGRRMNL